MSGIGMDASVLRNFTSQLVAGNVLVLGILASIRAHR